MPKNVIALVEREVPIQGTLEHVGMVLRAYESRGHLLSTDEELMKSATRIGDRVAIRARLMMPPGEAAKAVNETARAVRSALLFVGVCMASALLMIWLVITVVGALLSRLDVTSSALAGVALVAFLIWSLLSARRGHPCRGLHCSGCSAR